MDAVHLGRLSVRPREMTRRESEQAHPKNNIDRSRQASVHQNEAALIVNVVDPCSTTHLRWKRV